MVASPESDFANVFGLPTPKSTSPDDQEPTLTEWEKKKLLALEGTDGNPVKIHDALYGLLVDEATSIDTVMLVQPLGFFDVCFLVQQL